MLGLLFVVGSLVVALAVIAAIAAVIGFTIRSLFWVILLPFKLLLGLLFLPFLILKLLIGILFGIVMLPVVGVLGAIALVIGVGLFGALLIGPLLPLLVVGLIVWVIVKAARPAIA